MYLMSYIDFNFKNFMDISYYYIIIFMKVKIILKNIIKKMKLTENISDPIIEN